MKKTLSIIMLCILFAATCHAQEQQKRIHIGPRVGFSVGDSKAKGWKHGGFNYYAYTNTEFYLNVGIMIDFTMWTKDGLCLALQSTPQYNQKGCWFMPEFSNMFDNPRSIYMHYIDIPLQAYAKYRISKRQSLVLGIGPTFNIGLVHRHKKHPDEHYQFGEGEGKNGLHRLDIGAVVNLGLESAKGLRIELNYFIPLRNLSIDKSKSYQFFQTGITVGYLF